MIVKLVDLIVLLGSKLLNRFRKNFQQKIPRLLKIRDLNHTGTKFDMVIMSDQTLSSTLLT